MTMYIIILLIV